MLSGEEERNRRLILTLKHMKCYGFDVKIALISSHFVQWKMQWKPFKAFQVMASHSNWCSLCHWQFAIFSRFLLLWLRQIQNPVPVWFFRHSIAQWHRLSIQCAHWRQCHRQQFKKVAISAILIQMHIARWKRREKRTRALGVKGLKRKSSS